MTETEFDQVKATTFNTISSFVNTLGRPPTYEEFHEFADRVRRALPLLCPTVNISDNEFKKILRAIRSKFTVQMEGEETFVESSEHKK